MAKFRKKPVVVEAEQYKVGSPLPAGVVVEHPTIAELETLLGSGSMPSIPPDGKWKYVTTIHGQKAFLEDGDWIVAEPDGIHFYPVKPDIFEATYEPAE